VALISKGKMNRVIRVGRLDTARDFIDVRDGVAGIMLLLEKGRSGQPTNICTGEAITVREALETLLELGGVEAEIQEAAEFLRPSDEPLLLGDNSRLRALGWTRRYTIRETLGEVLKDWMNRVE
jgi:GDP-4-dehydro-6-deoxy-D-mannose reductase